MYSTGRHLSPATNTNIHNNYDEDTPRHVKQPPQTAFQLFELVDNSNREYLNGEEY